MNSLLYADDLVILSKSKTGLDNCLKVLECFNAKWLLNVNYRKTKILVFQKSGKNSKHLSFSINSTPIEIVQEYTYLGIRITSSGTFTIAQKVLAEKALNAIFKIRKHINFSKLPIGVARKLFVTAIQPILTYGCEVWGAYIKLNFHTWDKTPIEKTHLRFCKMFLGLNRKASNHATRSEMGSFPLQIVITRHILTYYYYLNSKDDSSIVKQALNIMHENCSKIVNSYINNIDNILKFCNNSFSGKPDDITNSVIRETTTQLQNKYSEYWKSKICSSSRLEFFSKIKENFVEEPFLDEVKNYDVKRNFFKI